MSSKNFIYLQIIPAILKNGNTSWIALIHPKNGSSVKIKDFFQGKLKNIQQNIMLFRWFIVKFCQFKDFVRCKEQIS